MPDEASLLLRRKNSKSKTAGVKADELHFVFKEKPKSAQRLLKLVTERDTYLKLCSKSLVEFHNYFVNYENLQEISLENTNLLNLDFLNNISCSLATLKRLCLARNKLEHINLTLISQVFPAILSIDFSFNNIKSACNLETLEKSSLLNFASNKICSAADIIQSDNFVIMDLCLSNNMINTLEGICMFKNLSSLNLADNLIQTISNNNLVFLNSVPLVYLDRNTLLSKKNNSASMRHLPIFEKKLFTMHDFARRVSELVNLLFIQDKAHEIFTVHDVNQNIVPPTSPGGSFDVPNFLNNRLLYGILERELFQHSREKILFIRKLSLARKKDQEITALTMFTDKRLFIIRIRPCKKATCSSISQHWFCNIRRFIVGLRKQYILIVFTNKEELKFITRDSDTTSFILEHFEDISQSKKGFDFEKKELKLPDYKLVENLLNAKDNDFSENLNEKMLAFQLGWYSELNTVFKSNAFLLTSEKIVILESLSKSNLPLNDDYFPILEKKVQIPIKAIKKITLYENCSLIISLTTDNICYLLQEPIEQIHHLLFKTSHAAAYFFATMKLIWEEFNNDPFVVNTKSLLEDVTNNIIELVSL